MAAAAASDRVLSQDEIQSRLSKVDTMIMGPIDKYVEAISTLSQDLDQLKRNSAEIPRLIGLFNQFMLTQSLLGAPSEEEDTGAGASGGAEAAEPSLFDSANLAARVDFSILGDATGMSKEQRQAHANMHELFKVVAESMETCQRKFHLVYHNIGHAMEMAHDPAFLMNKMGYGHWKLFMSVCGLFHDAVFERARVADEQASAALMINALKSFMDTLNDTDRTAFEALIRAVIIGGTLPAFTKKQSTPPGPPTQMKAVWEVLIKLAPELASDPDLTVVFSACQAMSDSDVQRSLMIEILKAFPMKGKTAEERAAIAAGVEQLTRIVKQYLTEEILAKRPAAAEAKDEGPSALLTEAETTQLNDMLLAVMIKLGQSWRFSAEDKAPGTPPTKALNEQQLKHAQGVLNNDASVEYNPDDITKTAKSLGGEHFFAGLNKASLSTQQAFNPEDKTEAETIEDEAAAGTGAGADITKSSIKERPYAFCIESWDWHIAIFTRIQSYLNNPGIEQEDKQALLKALNFNAGSECQQGLNVDTVKLMQFLTADLAVESRLDTDAACHRVALACGCAARVQPDTAPLIDDTAANADFAVGAAK